MRVATDASKSLRNFFLVNQLIPIPFGDPSLRAHIRSHFVQDDKGLRVTRNRDFTRFTDDRIRKIVQQTTGH